MLEFEALKPFFSFLDVLMFLGHHWNDSIKWVMVKCMHKQFIEKMKKFIANSKYLTWFYDKVTSINNQSCISIHSSTCYSKLVSLIYIHFFKTNYKMRSSNI
jgi:hypothetical protein